MNLTINFFDTIIFLITIYVFIYFVSSIGIAIFSVLGIHFYKYKDKFTDYDVLVSSSNTPSVSVISYIYNQADVVVNNIQSLLFLHYNNFDVIIVNDESTDDSLAKMITAYELEEANIFRVDKIPTERIKAVYKSTNPKYRKLIVIDKVKGGKADALNAGINTTQNRYITCIDSDCILEQEGLLMLLKPFLEQTTKKVVATSAMIRLSNSFIVDNHLENKEKLGTRLLLGFQTLEYWKSFLLENAAWIKINSLMLIPNALRAYNRKIVVECGGYNKNAVKEGIELTMRIRQHMEKKQIPYKITYIPKLLCWTKAPTTYKKLGVQRNRWTRGFLEALITHKKVFFNSKHKLQGFIVYPYWLFLRILNPIIKCFIFLFFIIATYLNYISYKDTFLLFFVTYLMFVLYSLLTILLEVIMYHQYQKKKEVFLLMLFAIIEPFTFQPFLILIGVKTGVKFLLKKKK